MQPVTKLEERPARRPAHPLDGRVAITPKGAGYLDGAAGLPAYPAGFGRRGGEYLVGYLRGVRDGSLPC